MTRTGQLISGQTGFYDQVYRDAGDEFLFGYGFRNFTRAEAELILQYRIENIREKLSYRTPCFNSLSSNRQDVLVLLAYLHGLLAITGKLQDALKHKQWERAARELAVSMDNKNSDKIAKMMVEG